MPVLNCETSIARLLGEAVVSNKHFYDEPETTFVSGSLSDD